MVQHSTKLLSHDGAVYASLEVKNCEEEKQKLQPAVSAAHRSQHNELMEQEERKPSGVEVFSSFPHCFSTVLQLFLRLTWVYLDERSTSGVAWKMIS